MALRYFNLDQVMAAARSALRPRLLTTMALTLAGAVVISGLFGIGGHASGFVPILWRLIGAAVALIWALFGLTALAHQMTMAHAGEATPGPRAAAGFAWRRMSSLLALPAWGVALLLALALAEMLALLLARIPGLGALWLSLVAVPLLLLNTLVALGLLLALFNIAVRVALAPQDGDTLRDTLWRLLRTHLPELLIYNLGGVLAATLVAIIGLSPLWLGWWITHDLVGYVAGGTMASVVAATGFWGSLAHLVGLVMVGLLVAAVASVPCIVITYLTLMVHMELDAEASSSMPARAKPEAEPSDDGEKKAPTRRRAAAPRATGTAKPKRKTGAKPAADTEPPAAKPKRKPKAKPAADTEPSAPKPE